MENKTLKEFYDLEMADADVSDSMTGSQIKVTALLAASVKFLMNALPEPKGFEHAMTFPEWIQSMKEELGSITDHDVYTVTKIPPGVNIVSTKWVYKVKTYPYLRYKSRLVARGFSQKQGMDYEETYSPTLNFTSIRMLLSYAASYDRELIHWDIGTAFLNGILEEDIYI